MMKKISTLAFVALVTMAATDSLADDPVINVNTYVVQGSVWDGPAGTLKIQDQIQEATKICPGAGVNIVYNSSITKIYGDPDKESKSIRENWAKTLNASERNIVLVFSNKAKVLGGYNNRAYTEASLVKANTNTPVMVIGARPYSEPGTKRDVAHETGHVLFRSGEEVNRGAWEVLTGTSGNLMNQGKDISNILTQEQKDKAKEYLSPAARTAGDGQPGKTPDASSGKTPIQTSKAGSDPTAPRSDNGGTIGDGQPGKTPSGSSGKTPIQTSRVGSDPTGPRSDGGGTTDGVTWIPVPSGPANPCPYVPRWDMPEGAYCSGGSSGPKPADTSSAVGGPKTPAGGGGEAPAPSDSGGECTQGDTLVGVGCVQ